MAVFGCPLRPLPRHERDAGSGTRAVPRLPAVGRNRLLPAGGGVARDLRVGLLAARSQVPRWPECRPARAAVAQGARGAGGARHAEHVAKAQCLRGLGACSRILGLCSAVRGHRAHYARPGCAQGDQPAPAVLERQLLSRLLVGARSARARLSRRVGNARSEALGGEDRRSSITRGPTAPATSTTGSVTCATTGSSCGRCSQSV